MLKRSLNKIILFRLHIYIYKIIHYMNSPRNLSIQFLFNSAFNKKYNLRNINDFYIPSIGVYNDNGSKKFIYFFSKFIYEIMTRHDIELNIELFKARVKNNINLLSIDFINIFKNFNLKIKTFYDNKLKNK